MRIIQCRQGTPEWEAARFGLPTASQFGRILTPTGKPSAQAQGYLHQLVAERLLGHPVDAGAGEWAARGQIMEAEAVAYYEMMRGLEVQAVGFTTTDDGRAGCSPDRLVGNDGLLEIKCPSAAVHVGYLLGDEASKYKPQVQGQLWVTGRRWCDWLSYCPELPPALVRHERDEEYIAALASEVYAFADRVAEAHERLAWVDPQRTA